jgi:uncharacterized repeat protein (TIGR03943 family)
MSRFRSVRLLLISTVFLVLAATFTWLLMGDRYSMYLSRKLWPLILVGALGSLLLSIGLLFSRLMARREHETRGDLMTAGILLLPLLYLVVHEGDTLGAYAFRQRSVSMVESVDSPLTFCSDGDTVRTDLHRLLTDYPTLLGRPLVVEGALDVSGERPVLFRFMIVCCLNDAVPQAMFVESAGLDSLQDDTWLTIRGTADTLMIDGLTYPCVKEVEFAVIPAPSSPYMYP